MANANNPFGFEPWKSEGKENRVKVYPKTAAAAVYPGDAVKLVAGGTVEVAAAGDVIIGVAAGYAAAADSFVSVYDDPDMEFIAQMSGTVAATDVGQTTNIVATAADTTRKQSNHALDSAAMGVLATAQFKIVGLLARGDNAAGNYCIVICKPQSHILGSKPVGI